MTIDELVLTKEDPKDELDLDANSMGLLLAGERIRIQAGPSGDPTTLFDEQVPAGKVWKLWVHVRGEESDA